MSDSLAACRSGSRRRRGVDQVKVLAAGNRLESRQAGSAREIALGSALGSMPMARGGVASTFGRSVPVRNLVFGSPLTIRESLRDACLGACHLFGGDAGRAKQAGDR